MPPKVVRGFLRSRRADFRPKLSSAVYSKPKELKYLIHKPVYSATSKSPIIRGIDVMITRGVRRVPITGSKNELLGMVTATDVVNFLGGGDYYKIVKSKHKGRFFSALYEPLESIMSRDVVCADLSDTFSSVLEKTILKNHGAIPIVGRSKRLVGIITEYDVVRYLSGRTMTEKVRDHMTRNPLFASPNISIRSAARLMVSNGFRRIPLKKKDEVVGMVTTVDIVRYIGEGSAFRRLLLDEMDRVMSVPVSEIMRTGVVFVKSDLSLGDAAPLISGSGVGAVLAEEDGDAVGILTERDLLTALAIE